MRQKIYTVLILLIIVALGITFYENLSYYYVPQGEMVDLSVCQVETFGYDIIPVSGVDGLDFTPIGKDFTVTDNDPQLILTLPVGMTTGGVVLDFDMDNSTNIPIQVFYAKSGEDYSERHSVKGVLKSGEESVQLPIPQGEYCTLRFDIDGNFRLSKLTGAVDKMKAIAYISQDTIEACVWLFPAIIFGFCLIFWAHGVRVREGGFSAGAYVKNIFLGAEPSPNRETYFDYLRILAAVFVILAHTCSPMLDMADSSWKRFVLVCGLSLGLCCNLLYVMLSGALLLNNTKKESVLSFYIRRASKVIIPLTAYYLLLLSLNDEVHFLPPRSIGAALKRIVTGAPDAAPHLWLIYTIVALYLVTPFFRVMVQHMGDKLIFSLAVVIMMLNMLTTYLPLFGMTFGVSTFLAGWEGVFILGYILTRQNNIKGASVRNKLMMFAAVVSYIVMLIVVFNNSSNMNYVYGSTPTMVVTSCGIFALFLTIKDKLKGKSNALVRLCSKYSYSIILIHWYALFVIVQGKFHITALRFGCVGGIVASVAATFVVCILMAIVFDNTVVTVCSVVFDKITSCIGTKKEYDL